MKDGGKLDTTVEQWRAALEEAAGTPVVHNQNYLLAWIRMKKGGRVTIRELQRGLQAFKGPEKAEKALRSLARAGILTVTNAKRPNGGVSFQYFTLTQKPAL